MEAEAPDRPNLPHHANNNLNNDLPAAPVPDQPPPLPPRPPPPPVALIPEHLRMEDIEAWLYRNGLRQGPGPWEGENQGNDDASNANRHQNRECTLDQQEDMERWQELHNYQKTVLQSMFAQEEAQEQERQRTKQQQLETLRYGTLVLQTQATPEQQQQDQPQQPHTRDDITFDLANLPLYPFAKSCDTVFALATTRWDCNSERTIAAQAQRQEQPLQQQQQQQQQKSPLVVHCQLLEYSTLAIKLFVRLVLRQHDDDSRSRDDSNNKNDDDEHVATNRVLKLLEEELEPTPNATNETVGHENDTKKQTKVPSTSDHDNNNNNNSNNSSNKSMLVVECCCLADYLQNQPIRNAAERILRQSIDTSNCLSMCQLADHLGMPTLFELALQHMMQTLGAPTTLSEEEPGLTAMAKEEKDDDEVAAVVEDILTPELRERISLIQKAIQSSVHDTQHRKLYFHSLKEYIALFAERVQYMKERLAEAKEQQEELRRTLEQEEEQIRLRKQQEEEETEGTNNSNQRRSGLYGFALNAYSIRPPPPPDVVSWRLWNDTQCKIHKQEQRVQTVMAVLAEQKKLFGQHNHHPTTDHSFALHRRHKNNNNNKGGHD